MPYHLPQSYSRDHYGFVHQKEHDHFVYTVDYRNHQSTNIEMSYLRLGWLSSHFSYERMKKMSVVDIGCGSGMFVKCCQGKFAKVVGYDVVGESITKEELMSTCWDLIVLSDVLEHFENLEDVMNIKWRFAMISFPETPKVHKFEDLTKWRHFKPNEHLHYLTLRGLQDWFGRKGCIPVASGNFEDLIRKRWSETKTNISTLLVDRPVLK